MKKFFLYIILIAVISCKSEIKTKLETVEVPETETVDDPEKEIAYNKQPHRFEFINGMLYYNSFQLYKGQKLSDFENKFGKNYIETQKEEGSNYRVIQYKNIPLEIISDDGIIRVLTIQITNEEHNSNKDYLYLNSDLIKLEGYFFNKDIDSLTFFTLKLYIQDDLNRDFDIGNFGYKGVTTVIYGASNDPEKKIPEPSFLMYTKNEKELLRISYSEELF